METWKCFIINVNHKIHSIIKLDFFYKPPVGLFQVNIVVRLNNVTHSAKRKQIFPIKPFFQSSRTSFVRIYSLFLLVKLKGICINMFFSIFFSSPTVGKYGSVIFNRVQWSFVKSGIKSELLFVIGIFSREQLFLSLSVLFMSTNQQMSHML